jgi:hypothetical protein
MAFGELLCLLTKWNLEGFAIPDIKHATFIQYISNFIYPISEMNSIIFYSVKILNLVQKLLLSKYYSNHMNVLKFRNLMTSKTKLIIEKVFCDPV